MKFLFLIYNSHNTMFGFITTLNNNIMRMIKMMKTLNKILFILISMMFYTLQIDAFESAKYIFQLESGTQTDIDNITAPKKGSMVFNTTDNKIYDYNGSNWININKTIVSMDPNNSIGVGADGGAYFSNIPNVIHKTADYTLTKSDNAAVFTFDSTTDMTLTLPTGLPVGFNVSIYQINTGKVHIVGSGTTVLNRLSRFKTAGKDAGVGIVSTNKNIFHLTGDLKK